MLAYDLSLKQPLFRVSNTTTIYPDKKNPWLPVFTNTQGWILHQSKLRRCYVLVVRETHETMRNNDLALSACRRTKEITTIFFLTPPARTHVYLASVTTPQLNELERVSLHSITFSL